MKQFRQSLTTGGTEVVEIPAPATSRHLLSVKFVSTVSRLRLKMRIRSLQAAYEKQVNSME